MPHLSKFIKEFDWKYSIREIVLIVIGILVALALNNWNEERIRDKNEGLILQEIQTSLNKDLLSLESSIKILENSNRSIALVLDHLKSKQSYSDTLDSHFANTVTAAIFLEDRGAYETLTNKGRELITNDSLRTSLASLYAHDYTYLKKVEKIDFDHMVNNVAPYYSSHFKDFHFAITATPVDYEALKNDNYFLGLLEWLRADREILLARYYVTKEKIENLLRLLEKEV